MHIKEVNNGRKRVNQLHSVISNCDIIESVDSICRDGADTPISPIQK